MTDPAPEARIPSDGNVSRAIRLRLLAALIALAAGVAALIVAVLLVRTALS